MSMLIQPYQSSWKNDFNSIKSNLEKALIDIEVTIEHVGSTSVPELAAKPIIDIDIIFYSENEFKSIKLQLENAGYYHNGDQGIPGREVFKRNPVGSKPTALDTIKHHLYVCHSSSAELKKHLTFRDFLLKNETARSQYQALKYQIAEEANQDPKTYAHLKEIKAKSFIESIVKTKLQI